jgi:hypothetical protein
MVNATRRIEKINNAYMDVEYKKAETLAYWQAFMNRPK